MKRHRFDFQYSFIQILITCAKTAALKEYYDNMTDEDTHEKTIAKYEFFSKRISPILALMFVAIYWLVF